MRRLRRAFLGILGLFALCLILAFGWLQTDTGRQQVSGWLEAATKDGNARLKLGTITGTVPTDMTISNLQLSDRQGPWLQATNIHLRWSIQALLAWQAKIDVLQAETMALLRPPPSDQSGTRTNNDFAFPHLPINIELDNVSVAKFALAPSILGSPMTISVTAKAAIARNNQLDASLSIQRLDDADGSEDIAGEIAYRPASDHLKIALRANESKGGLIGRVLGLRGNRKLAITAQGDAPLSAWSGALAVRLDDRAVLDLNGTLNGPTDSRRFDIALTAQPADFLPPQLQTLVSGGLRTTATGHLARGLSRVTIDNLQVTSATLDLAADGSLDLDGNSDLRLHLKSLASEAVAATVPGVSWRSATFDGAISGPIDLPAGQLSGVINGLQYDGNDIGKVSFSIDGKSGASAASPVSISATVDASEIAPQNPKLAPMVKDGVRLDLAGSLDRQGKIDATSLTISAGAVAFQGSARSDHWGQQVQASGALDLADLSILRDVSGMSLKGKLHIAAQATRAANALSLTLDGTAIDFASGQAEIDNLLGSTPSLGLTIDQTPDREIRLQRAELAGRGLSVKGSGQGSPTALAFNIDGTVADLAGIDKQMTGALAWRLKIGGSLDHPVIESDINAGKISAMNVTATNVALHVAVPDLTALAGITATGQASINGIPAGIVGTLDFPETQGKRAVQLAAMQLHLGRSTLHAQGKIADSLLAGQLAMSIPDLAELQPLTQMDAHGRLNLDLTLIPHAGQQDGTASLSGDGLAYGKAINLGHLTATTTFADLFGASTNSARMDIKDATLGQQKLTTLRVLMDGPLRRMSIDLQAAGPHINASLGGSISHATDRDSATIERGRLVANGRQIDLLQSATITHQAAGTHIDKLTLKSGNGQVTLTADLAPESNQISLELHHLALDLLAAFAPEIAIKGDVDGSLRVDGPNRNPRAAAKLNLTQLTSTTISMPPASAILTATWENGRVAANGDISLGTQQDVLTLSAALPMPTDPTTGFPRIDGTGNLTAAAKGHFDLALINPLLGSSVDQIGGQAEIDMTATGALSAPEMHGHLAITDGRYDNLRYGTRLKAIQAQVTASGSRFELSSFNARTPDNGSLSGSGDIDLARKNPVAITIQAKNAQLIDNAMGSAAADADLTLSSQDPQHIALAGTIKVVKAEIRIPDQVSSSVQEIAVVERNTGNKTSASSAANTQPAPPVANQSPMKISLDMNIDAPQQVAVRGRGLDAELGGKLRIFGDINQPAITGQLKLRRGKFNLVGHSLNFDRGVISFDGGTPIDPQLDFAAKAKAEGYDITALVGGTASKPSLSLSSTPTLPQDEILARLLFGKAAGSLTAIQAVQLAQATAELAGINGGPDILDQLRRATGLDRLTVDAGESATTKTTATGPSLSAGRYVAPGVYLGVKQGAKPNTSAATVEIEVTPHIKVETDVGGAAGSKAGINMQWDY